MRFRLFIFTFLIFSGCIAGGKLKHKYSEPWVFRAGTDTWFFDRDHTFSLTSVSRDHVKQHDCYWGTWEIKNDSVFIFYSASRNMANEKPQKISYEKADTLFIHKRKLYEEKVIYGTGYEARIGK